MNQIGRYKIKHEIGRGGMATVYLAEDPRFGREVAIKTLPHNFLHDSQLRGRFDQEARAIARLEHPAIVPVYDVGEEGEQPYLVMRYMAGGSLAQKLAQKRSFRFDEALPIVQRIAAALDCAHRAGIIHRDLKPGNILFDNDNNAYLGDFGIAYLAEASMAFTGDSIIGTPTYMSPEQARGDRKMDGRSDIYSLGVLLYEMLTGKPPYDADTAVGIAMRHINDPIPHVTDLNTTQPSSVNLIVATAMAKDREKRYQTGEEFARALENITYDQTPAAPATTKIDDNVDDGLTVLIQPVTRPKRAPSTTAQPIQPAKPVKKAAVPKSPTSPTPPKSPTSPLSQGSKGGLPRWLYPALGIFVLLFVLLAGAIFTLQTRTNNPKPTPSLVRPENTPNIVAVLDDTETPEPIDTVIPTSTSFPSAVSTKTSQPTNTAMPIPPTSVPITVSPIVVATNTPLPTPTSTSVPTNTPSPTETTVVIPTNTPTPTALPTITPTTSPSARIVTFTTSRVEATVGDEIIVAWQVDGAPTVVSLSQFINSNPTAVFDEAVEAVGERTFSVTDNEMNGREIVFQLVIEGVTSESVTVALTCDHDFFFTASDILPNNLCPLPPVQTSISEQRFANGTLYWLETFDQIYIHLFNGGSRKLSDDWRIGMPKDSCPDLTTANPAFKPNFGFGLVWCTNPDLRAELGEPIEGASNFPSVSQSARPNRTIEWIKVRAGHILEIPITSGTWTERPAVKAD